MKQRMKDFSKITAILRGYDYDQVECAVEVLKESSVKAVEITLNRSDSKQIIEKIVKKYGDAIAVGAGTVLSQEDLQDVVDCGVDFVLSPSMLSKPMLDYCKTHRVMSVPGAFSPTEVYQSLKDGADIVKIFPATRVGSKYLKDIRAPFGDIPLMVVGGVNAENIREYFQAGAGFAGIASGLFLKEDVLTKNRKGMKKSLKIFQGQIEGI
jgi:2-dehydro-3-deoxyphosphogluconate aldolase/(4S)-4-hydroxy-2-oxoglutarate aldolase